MARVPITVSIKSPVNGAGLVGIELTVTKHVPGAAKLGEGEAAAIYLTETEGAKVSGDTIVSDSRGGFTQGESASWALYWLPPGSYDFFYHGSGTRSYYETREFLSGGEGGIGSEQLAAGSVTEAKLAADAVTEGKLGEEAVGSSKIKALAVTTAKIAAAAVTAAKLGSEAVETAAIKALAVTSAKLAEGAVTSAKLAEGAVTSAKLAPTVGLVPASAITLNEGWQTCATLKITPTVASKLIVIATFDVDGVGSSASNVSCRVSLDGGVYSDSTLLYDAASSSLTMVGTVPALFSMTAAEHTVTMEAKQNPGSGASVRNSESQMLYLLVAM